MPRLFNSLPREDGFRMPGEFEQHSCCWMLWPERPDNWRLNAAPAQAAFVEVAKAISRFEPVIVGISFNQFTQARLKLPDHIRPAKINSDDAWMRDVGPTFVVNDLGETRAIDWEFNGWGKPLYTSWENDSQVTRSVMNHAKINGYKTTGFVMEGGSITVDGQGTLITTEECLLNPNRNPSLSRAEIEQKLRDYLGVIKIIWLGRGVFNDETSGHVDNLCCFVRPGTVALTWCDDATDPQYEISHEAYEILTGSTDAAGRRIDIHKIHSPEAQVIAPHEHAGIIPMDGTWPRKAGDRLAASYVNFYIANGGVIVPTFNSKFDQPALQTIQNLFPGRKVVGIYSREILLGGGNIHCITQQQPSSQSLF